MKLKDLRPLKDNPFKSTGDEQIKQIGQSIQEFEKMLSIRKIVIDENNEIIGGNKRFFALKALGYTEIPDGWIDKQTDLTDEEKRRFIVTDNAHYGSFWDYETLQEWNVPATWGVDIPDWVSGDGIDLGEFFSEGGKENDSAKSKIILEYTEDDYNKVINAFEQMEGTKEQIVFKLLNV